jgi:hypothetical protein
MAQRQGVVTYIRIEEANVVISACKKHLKILIDTLRNRKEKKE